MFCMNCGKQIKENDNHCGQCGFNQIDNFLSDQDNFEISTQKDIKAISYEAARNKIYYLQNELDAVIEKLKTLKLELQMANASSRASDSERIMLEVKELLKISNELELSISDMNSIIQTHKEFHQQKRAEHQDISRQFFIEWQKWVGISIVGFLVLLYIFVDLIVRFDGGAIFFGFIFFVLVLWFMYSFKKISYFGKLKDEHANLSQDHWAYAEGRTEKEWAKEKEGIAYQVEQEHKNRQLLAEEIAKKMKE